MKDGRQIPPFVYFDQDRYRGYMWFSSVSKRETGRPPLRLALQTVGRAGPCESRGAAQSPEVQRGERHRQDRMATSLSGSPEWTL
jgi:hypothetical protein